MSAMRQSSLRYMTAVGWRILAIQGRSATTVREAYNKLVLTKEYHFSQLQQKDAFDCLSTHLSAGTGPAKGARPRINRRKAVWGLVRQLEDRRVSAAIRDRSGKVQSHPPKIAEVLRDY